MDEELRERIERLERTKLYMNNMSPVLNKRALFSDETEQYLSPMEADPGDKVTIRFRTEKDNVDYVFWINGSEKQEMRKEKTIGQFDYYRIDIVLEEEPISYYFEIGSNKERCFYNRRGISRDLQDYYAFGIVPGFHTPDWAKGAVMYQIFVDRFCNGDQSNDVQNREYIYINDGTTKVEDWYQYPRTSMEIRDFYGGDLQGVMDKLDYLEDLGVEVIYLNPIFVSPSNHKYDIQDYDYVDPHYGRIVKDGGECLAPGDNDNSHASKYIQRVTDKENLEASNQLLVELIEEVHRRGMKLILDGVFNHCGSFNKWLDRERIYENQPGYEKGAYVAADSPYRDFFKFNNEHEWPYNEFYDGWWGHNTLPKLNYEKSEHLFEYIMSIGRKWVSPPFNADGWRLDVAADLGHSNEYNHQFWKAFRQEVKKCNPNAIVLAEHYGDAQSWLQGDEWDTVMNYDAFMEPITWFLTGMEKHSDEYRPDMLGNAEALTGALSHHMASFYMPSLQTAMNELSNHDHSRFLTRTNHLAGRVDRLGSQAAEQNVNKAVFREAVAMQMTWPGAPTIYYGDEAGVCGFTDPDNRRTFPWGREDRELLNYHKEMIRIHKENTVLKHGSIKFLAEEHGIFAYGRFDLEHQIVVALNNENRVRTIEIPVWELGIQVGDILECVMESTETGYTTEERLLEVESSYIRTELKPLSATIWKKREN